MRASGGNHVQRFDVGRHVTGTSEGSGTSAARARGAVPLTGTPDRCAGPETGLRSQRIGGSSCEFAGRVRYRDAMSTPRQPQFPSAGHILRPAPGTPFRAPTSVAAAVPMRDASRPRARATRSRRRARSRLSRRSRSSPDHLADASSVAELPRRQRRLDDYVCGAHFTVSLRDACTSPSLPSALATVQNRAIPIIETARFPRDGYPGALQGAADSPRSRVVPPSRPGGGTF
jgi:hypothetical protein